MSDEPRELEMFSQQTGKTGEPDDPAVIDLAISMALAGDDTLLTLVKDTN